jgi:hypothetical protein
MEWFVPPHSTRSEILRDARQALDILARNEGIGEDERRDLEQVEGLLEGIEERLMQRRWI